MCCDINLNLQKNKFFIFQRALFCFGRKEKTSLQLENNSSIGTTRDCRWKFTANILLNALYIKFCAYKHMITLLTKTFAIVKFRETCQCNCRQIKITLLCYLLRISTSEWVLCTLFAGWNQFFDAKTTFYLLFSSCNIYINYIQTL